MKLNLLVAYPYMTKDLVDFIKANEDDICLALDSGAFTAWKANKIIDVDDYCRFLEKLPVKPHFYFSLDVIGKPGETMANYQAMLSRGFKPVPVFTRGEDPSVIDEYYKTSDIVGIGGLVKTPRNKGFVKGIMPHVGDRKCHWLGFVDKNFITHYKPYSCDSSTFLSARMYGHVAVFDHRTMSWETVSKFKKPRTATRKMAHVLSSYGVDPIEITSEAWRGPFIKQILDLSMRSHCRASLVYEKVLNTKYFLATTGKHDVERLFYNFKKERIGL